MATIDVNDAYILDETGAEVDKVTGLFTKDENTTSGEKAFAQLNIGTAGSNRNLLDNPFFTIDQTAETSGAATGGTAKDTRDRWRIARCSEYTFNNDGTVTTKWDGTGSGCYLIQYGLLDNAAFYKGKTCTLSFYADGTLYQKTITMPTGTNTSFTLGGVSVNVNDITNTGRGYECQFYHSVSAGKTLGPFKLEKGSVSTLPNDGPPDYEEELLKCLRCFQRIKASAGYSYIGTGACLSATSVYAVVNLPAPLRNTSPTVSVNGTLSAQVPGAFLDGSAFYTYVRTPSTMMVQITVSGATAGQGALLTLKNSGNYIDLSCRPS